MQWRRGKLWVVIRTDHRLSWSVTPLEMTEVFILTHIQPAEKGFEVFHALVDHPKR